MPDLWSRYVSWLWFAAFESVCLLGIFLSLFTAQHLKQKFWTHLGNASLGIMLLHKFMVVALQFKLPFLTQTFAQGGVFTLVAIILITSIALSISYYLTLLLRRYIPLILGETH